MLRFLGWGAFFPMLAEAGVGILFLSLPENSLHVLSVSVGILFCFLGVLLLASAFFRAKAGFVRLGLGVIVVGFAVWLFVQPTEAVKILLYVLLAVLFLHTLAGMWNALARNRSGGRWWQLQFTACLVLAISAVVVCFLPFGFTVCCVVTGVLYVLAAALGLSSRLVRLFSPIKTAAKERNEEEGEEGEEKEPSVQETAPSEKKGRRKRKREQEDGPQS